MRLKTLGGLALTTSSGEQPLRRPKPLLLLAYLAIEGPKERHHLAELFWPAANHTLDSLRVALSQIRTAAPGVLSEAKSPGAGASVGTSVGCDALELLAALTAANSRRIKDLYAGEFLAGFYLKEMGAELEEWILGTRERLAYSVQLARIVKAEAVATERAFAEAGNIAAEALALARETDSDLLPRLHRLLLAAGHPAVGAVERQAAALGLELNGAAEVARLALSPTPKHTARNNLPAKVAPFVGRDTELVTLANLLASGSRLVTVTGVGGVGKSRLALEAATSALREGLFDDGVFLVELAPVSDPRFVLEAITAAASGEEASAKASGADAAGLRGSLGDKRVMLLLDNFEHVAEAATDVATLLEKCPGVSVLVTSRQRLELSGEQIFQLDAMALTTATASAAEALTLDAVRLFQTAARRNDLTFAVSDANHQDVLEVCGHVHGLPLGIELAAALVGPLRLPELAAALRRGTDELPSGPRDAPERHRTLTATIDHSWRLLTEDERLALTKLAVFVGGFTHDAAAGVAAASIAMLASLTAKSLLHRSAEDRYTMHPLVGDFAGARLRSAGHLHDTALSRHADHLVELVRHAEEGLKTGDQASWLRRLDAELPNLRAALDWLTGRARQGSLEAARSALEVNGSLWQFWLRRGRLAEGRRLAEVALAAAPNGAHPGERAKALTAAGVLAFQQRDDPASESYHRAALALRRQIGDRLGEARSLYNLSSVAGRAGDLDTAEENLTSAIDIFESHGDGWSAAYALNNLSLLAKNRGRVDEAVQHLRERLRLQRELGDEAGTAETHFGIGAIGFSSGDLTAAESSFDESLRVARRTHDLAAEASALEGLAFVMHEKGLRSRCAKHLDAARAIREQYGLDQNPAFESLATLWAEYSRDSPS